MEKTAGTKCGMLWLDALPKSESLIALARADVWVAVRLALFIHQSNGKMGCNRNTKFNSFFDVPLPHATLALLTESRLALEKIDVFGLEFTKQIC